MGERREGRDGNGKKQGGKEVEAEKQEGREERKQVDFPFSFALITAMVPWR